MEGKKLKVVLALVTVVAAGMMLFMLLVGVGIGLLSWHLWIDHDNYHVMKTWANGVQGWIKDFDARSKGWEQGLKVLDRKVTQLDSALRVMKKEKAE